MKTIIMLLTNAFMPDPRPYIEAISLIKAGYNVKILCWDRGEGLSENEIVDGIKIERIRGRSSHGRGTSQIFVLPIVWFKMLCRLVREDFDIIWCHDFDTLPLGLAAGALKRRTIVFDSHEVYSKMLGDNVHRLVKKFVGFLEERFIRKADHIIVTCPAMEKYYASLGVKKMTVVGNLKDLELFHLPYEVLKKERENLGIKDELVICYIANFGPERIIEPLLDTVKDDKDLFLIIGGTGCQQALVEQFAMECPRIRYLGHVASNKVPLYTSLSDIVYYGYDKHAGMAEYCNPNKLFEALAAGRAFIGGDFGEMGDIVKAEQCGIALGKFDRESVKKAIGTMKDKDRLRVFMENARRAGAEKYNWKTAENALLKAVADIGRS